MNISTQELKVQLANVMLYNKILHDYNIKSFDSQFKYSFITFTNFRMFKYFFIAINKYEERERKCGE